MHSLAINTLAMDWIGLAIFAVFAVIGILGSLGKAAEKKKAEEAARQARQRRLEQSRLAQSNDLESLAAQRRAEIRRSAPTPRQPENITNVAQLRAREQAKREYERRAAALRAQYTATGNAPTAGSASPPKPISSGSERRPSAPPARRPSSTPARPAQATRPASPPQPVRPAAKPVSRLAPPNVLNTARDETDVPRQTVATTPPSQAAPPMQTLRPRRAALTLAGKRLNLTPGVMRSAVVLKEILDPPVALR